MKVAALSRNYIPLDTGRKFNVHTCDVQNVLCMFNSRPVSTGMVYFHKKTKLAGLFRLRFIRSGNINQEGMHLSQGHCKVYILFR